MASEKMSVHKGEFLTPCCPRCGSSVRADADNERQLNEAMGAVHGLYAGGGDRGDIMDRAYDLILERWPALDDVDKGFVMGCAMGAFFGPGGGRGTDADDTDNNLEEYARKAA